MNQLTRGHQRRVIYFSSGRLQDHARQSSRTFNLRRALAEQLTAGDVRDMSSELEQKFVAQCSAIGIAGQRNPAGVICFPAACAEVGDLMVYFDGGEITVNIPRITHCHFTPYEAGPGARRRTVSRSRA